MGVTIWSVAIGEAELGLTGGATEEIVTNENLFLALLRVEESAPPN